MWTVGRSLRSGRRYIASGAQHVSRARAVQRAAVSQLRNLGLSASAAWGSVLALSIAEIPILLSLYRRLPRGRSRLLNLPTYRHRWRTPKPTPSYKPIPTGAFRTLRPTTYAPATATRGRSYPTPTPQSAPRFRGGSKSLAAASGRGFAYFGGSRKAVCDPSGYRRRYTTYGRYRRSYARRYTGNYKSWPFRRKFRDYRSRIWE